MEFTKLTGYEAFEEWLIIKVELQNRLKYEFWFDNNYGLSIVKHRMYGIPVTYGAGEDLFEVAVTKKGEKVFNTPFTNSVIGHCTNKDVLKLLKKVKNYGG